MFPARPRILPRRHCKPIRRETYGVRRVKRMKLIAARRETGLDIFTRPLFLFYFSCAEEHASWQVFSRVGRLSLNVCQSIPIGHVPIVKKIISIYLCFMATSIS